MIKYNFPAEVEVIFNALLTEQESFLVKGHISENGQDLIFSHEQFIPGIASKGLGAYLSMVRFLSKARKTTRRYLTKRHRARPKIPWQEINTIKAEAIKDR